MPGGESIISQSSSPQSTSPKNCWMAFIFSGPRQITGRLGSCKRKDIETNFKFSLTSTALNPSGEISIFLSSTPSILAKLGPWISTSRSPTFNPFLAKARARLEATVLFPTPPFPLKTRSLFLILAKVLETFMSSSLSLADINSPQI